METFGYSFIATHYYATIPYGPIINAIYDLYCFNLEIFEKREKSTDSFKDFLGDRASKAMVYSGPVAYSEAFYERIKKCEVVDDCGEYIVMNFGVFANSDISSSNIC